MTICRERESDKKEGREGGGEGKEGVEGGAGGGPGAAEGWKGSDLPPHQEMGQLSVQVLVTVIVNLSRN